MKRLLSIVASLGLAGVMWVAWVILSVWANDPPARVEEVRWSNEAGEVGAPLVLNVSLEVPWHRELASAIPSRASDSLAFDRTATQFRSGTMRWNGFREWSAEIVTIPLAEKSVQGTVLSLPLTGGRRRNRATASVPLPPLEVSYVSTEEGSPDPSLELLTLDETPDPVVPELTPEPERSPLPMLLILLSLLLIGAVIYGLIRRRARGPLPWEKALHDLALLEKEGGDLEERYTRLADILKRYAGERFAQPVPAATTKEFPVLMEKIDLSGYEVSGTEQLCHVLIESDEVRFARRIADENDFAETVPAVRHFVEATIPPKP